jgi:hypothetical protein
VSLQRVRIVYYQSMTDILLYLWTAQGLPVEQQPTRGILIDGLATAEVAGPCGTQILGRSGRTWWLLLLLGDRVDFYLAYVFDDFILSPFLYSPVVAPYLSVCLRLSLWYGSSVGRYGAILENQDGDCPRGGGSRSRRRRVLSRCRRRRPGRESSSLWSCESRLLVCLSPLEDCRIRVGQGGWGLADCRGSRQNYIGGLQLESRSIGLRVEAVAGIGKPGESRFTRTMFDFSSFTALHAVLRFIPIRRREEEISLSRAQ